MKYKNEKKDSSKNRGMIKQTNSHIWHQLKKMMLQEIDELENY